jgi:hypothetical protein
MFVIAKKIMVRFSRLSGTHGWRLLLVCQSAAWLGIFLPAVCLGAVVVVPGSVATDRNETSDVGPTAEIVLGTGDWVVQSSNARNTVVAWDCLALQNQISSKHMMNAKVRLIMLDKVGPTSAVVVHNESSTEKGGKAVVSAVISGTGLVRFRVVVTTSDDAELVLAGHYLVTIRPSVLTN